MIKTRFAPSPTGKVHIGNIRVAIFNWLYARHNNGEFLLRIEDTDLERSTPEAIKAMLDAMEELGLDYDGEPLYQTKRREAHEAAAAKMLEDGNAWHADGGPVYLRLHSGLYDSSFITEPKDDASINYEKGSLAANAHAITHSVTSPKSGETYVTPVNWDALTDPVFILEDGSEKDGTELRKKCPEDMESSTDLDELAGGKIVKLLFKRRYVFFNDLVLGAREKPLDSLRDLVIVRSDGSPVFHIANVLDDLHQGVTHILRGNDHVENTYRHLFIYKALGETPPAYGHFPMIVNAKGKPYSKRDGDAYVGDFLSKGFFPEALSNFLALCGWSPGDDREIMARKEMAEAFTLDRVSASAAQFDMQKLEWMNQQYVLKMPEEDFCAQVKQELEKAGIDLAEKDAEWLNVLAATQRERINRLPEVIEKTAYIFNSDFEYQPKAVKKNLLRNEGQGLKTLQMLGDFLKEFGDWQPESIEKSLNEFAETNELHMGMVAQPLRIACTGTTVSPGIGDTLYLVGQQETIARIGKTLQKITIE